MFLRLDTEYIKLFPESNIGGMNVKRRNLALKKILMRHYNQMAWVGAMNNIKARAEEIVLNELIYA